MKNINLIYNDTGHLKEQYETDSLFIAKEENNSVVINATFPAFLVGSVRAYLQFRGGGDVVECGSINLNQNTATLAVDAEHLTYNFLKVGFEVVTATKEIRFEPVTLEVDEFVNIGGGSSAEGYTVTVKVGNVVTLEPGEQAYVRNSGTAKDAVFEFGIPKGELPDAELQYNPESILPQSGQAVAQAIAQLLGSAPENLDTLEELAKALNEDENFSAKVLAEIAKKVEKVDGKGLSTNDFTDAFKRMLENIDLTEIVPGSANLTTSRAVFELFENFATNASKQIEEVKKNIPTVDEELSEESTNPVQNKVVTEQINILQQMAVSALIVLNGTIDGVVYRNDLKKTFDTVISNDGETIEYPEIEAIDNVYAKVIHNGENIGHFPHKLKLKDSKAREQIGDIETALDRIIAIQTELLGGDAE